MLLVNVYGFART